MCFDAKTSLATFLTGTFLSLMVMTYALFQKQTSLALLSGGWMWVILMQWWEFMIWKNWEKHTASHFAYVFNIMQIPLLYFLFILSSPVSLVFKAIATGIVFVYLCIMLYPNINGDVTQQSGHLTYSWWSSRVRSTTYFIGLASIFLLLVRPFSWSMACVTTLFVLLGLSMLIYGQQNTPSLWCFFAVFFPVLALVYTKIFS
jgi:hypothetical protein